MLSRGNKGHGYLFPFYLNIGRAKLIRADQTKEEDTIGSKVDLLGTKEDNSILDNRPLDKFK